MVKPRNPALHKTGPTFVTQQVAGKDIGLTATLDAGSTQFSMASSSAIYKKHARRGPAEERGQIASAKQIEAYRLVKLTGEARYAVTLFANTAARAEIGVSQPNALNRKAVWVKDGPEVDAFATIFPDVRARSKAIRDYMIHRTIAGECYLIARAPVSTDSGYIDPPENPATPGQQWESWDDYLKDANGYVDVLDPAFDPETDLERNPNRDNPIWEIIAVTELQKIGSGNLAAWRVRLDNDNWVNLDTDDPVIRMWNPDPEKRWEAWSPIMSMITTLQEIEWETKHIFAQLKSRLMSAGVWFLPNNLTFPAPPPDSIEGGEEALATLNEAELFMLALAESSMQEMDADEISFPTVVTADPMALESIDKGKLIQFWSEIDDKAMVLRSDAIRRFALGMDLMPEDVLGSSGLAVTGAGGSAGSVNHWGVWANEEKTIANHAEPALDEFVGVLTVSVLRLIVTGTKLVIAYDTATLRMRADRSKESMELYDRGLIKPEVVVRENGFDPENDLMSPEERKLWLLTKLVSGSPSPEQMQAAFLLITGMDLPVQDPVSGNPSGADAKPRGEQGQQKPPSTDGHPYQGPPREQHDHTPAPFSPRMASCEVLVLRALEKAGNVVLNDGKRGRTRDKTTPPVIAHTKVEPAKTYIGAEFDFSLASTALSDVSSRNLPSMIEQMGDFCATLYNTQQGYTREALIAAIGGGK
ncbi:hypothetical protein [Aeromicrobium sp.]|uniref:hypothetical protein n=1 Tax=Aeromicrobium sp. TaxID=1871063 RepID=UPI0019A1B58F|nr:hypothetical protein [Aeromicrobium sp.]MBC7630315.1 hypothetical protein [Aeromicrobium sp.]